MKTAPYILLTISLLLNNLFAKTFTALGEIAFLTLVALVLLISIIIAPIVTRHINEKIALYKANKLEEEN